MWRHDWRGIGVGGMEHVNGVVPRRAERIWEGPSDAHPGDFWAGVERPEPCVVQAPRSLVSKSLLGEEPLTSIQPSSLPLHPSLIFSVGLWPSSESTPGRLINFLGKRAAVLCLQPL